MKYNPPKLTVTATGLMGLAVTDEVYHDNRNVVIPHRKQSLDAGRQRPLSWLRFVLLATCQA